MGKLHIKYPLSKDLFEIIIIHMNSKPIRLIFNIVVAVVPLFFLNSCSGNGGGDYVTRTRVLTGTITSSGYSSQSLRLAEDSPSECSDVAYVTAITHDEQIAGSLEDCVFRLELDVYERYLIAFLDASENFLGILFSSSGSGVYTIWHGSDADDVIEIGTVAIEDGKAIFSEDSYCDDDMCLFPHTCEDLGFEDADGDGLCDYWDSVIPTSNDIPPPTNYCMDSMQCVDAQYVPQCEISVSGGTCWQGLFSGCQPCREDQRNRDWYEVCDTECAEVCTVFGSNTCIVIFPP